MAPARSISSQDKTEASRQTCRPVPPLSLPGAVVTLALTLMISLAAPSAGTEPKSGLKPESIEIKFYMQPRYSARLDDGTDVDNSFRVRRSRLYLTSTVAPGIKGRLQLETRPEGINTREVWFEWSGSPATIRGLQARVGQYKKPFSYQEFRLPSSELNLIDRTLTNEFLENSLKASSYDQGAMITADLSEYNVPMTLLVGAFNGNGPNQKQDDNSGKELVARAEVALGSGIAMGGNVAVDRVGAPDSSQSVTLWGGDVFYENGPISFLTEILWGDNYQSRIKNARAPVVSFLGYYAEAVYRIGGWEPGVRFERFDPDTGIDNDGRTLLTAQAARSFGPGFRWQINLVHTIKETGDDSESELVSQWTIRL